jgi:hypothetical protein
MSHYCRWRAFLHKNCRTTWLTELCRLAHGPSSPTPAEQGPFVLALLQRSWLLRRKE